ncbi:hypothetical protein J3U01_08490 [Bifidobacterium sp. B4107]|uniref:hypothetical protein n=1 Tax=unclassified Bifidobacterium TaxID=2608897 RepID=UPI00226B2184|nr:MULTISPECIES: hypothetical protein [unclassified Bifidobacterium]MCX8648436.1 hypothetical protein [Bifidobacterium sp. B4107]MCX8652572.1 hypothetical protein [Bifidobacterium sp. B4111]MCX8659064.1 hypothetical protein [Bifidobacterium sp. B4114]
MDEEHTPDDGETGSLADADGSGGQPPQENDPQPGGDDLPPAIDPGGGSGPAGKPRPKWLAPVVVAVLAAAGLAGWKVYESHQHKSAMTDCTQSVKAMQSSVKSAQATLNRYRRAAGIQAGQVKDAKTVDAMHRTIKTAGDIKPQVVVCEASMSTSDLHAAADKAGRASNRLKGIDRYYAKAGKAVLASRDAKSLDDAKTALNAKKDEASKLLSDSDGKVADNAVRDSLQQAIGQAGSIKGDKAEAYQDAADALQSAMDQVNTSIQQKSQAAQAAPPAQAAASAARQPARRLTPAQQRPAFLLVGGGKATCPHAGPHTTMAAAPRQPPQHQQHRKAEGSVMM